MMYLLDVPCLDTKWWRMNFNVRPITELDIPEIARWFDSRKWPLPPVEGIGPTFGMIAHKHDVMYACIYSYTTGASIAYLEWPGTNPDVPQEQSMAAFDELIFHFKKSCEVSKPKIRCLCIVTASDLLANRFKKHGFKIQGDCFKAIWTLKD